MGQDNYNYTHQYNPPHGDPPPAYFPTAPIVEGPQPTVMVVVSPMMFGRQPQTVRCPFCQSDVITSVKYSEGLQTHLWAAVLCILGCIPCCLIPYCVDDLKNVHHYCPNCQRHLGSDRR